MSTRATGTLYEDIAVAFLQKQGLVLVERNFRLRDGEVDLIMREDDFIVFIEVKYRQSGAYADILEQIRQSQLARVRRSARLYLHLKGMPEHLTPCRFDIIAITGGAENVNWIKDAF